MAEGRCSLRIAREHQTRRFSIEIIDEDSGIVVARVRCSGEDFAAALTGCSIDDLQVTYGKFSLVGRQQIAIYHKVADVEPGDPTTLDTRRKARLEEATAELERQRPGFEWHARPGDLGNRHRANGPQHPNIYNVTFFGHTPHPQGSR